MKKVIYFFVLCLHSAYGQFSNPNYCLVNPLLEDGLVVSGTFTQNNSGKHDIAHFRQNTNGQANLVVNSNYGGASVWSGSYNIENFRGRVVNLDADGDGIHNEIAALHDNGNNTMSVLVWQYNMNYGTWNFNTAYTTAVGYDVSKVSSRIVAGDFDNDNRYDDIAAFYDYGNNNFKIHVFRFNGNYNMTYSWFYQVYGYNANSTTGRIVSGDFDRDGKIDDIAAMYDYGGNNVKMHVFNSNGSSMTQSNYYWEAYGYNPNMASGTFVAGNFDKSGIANHKNDDIVALYDYGNGNVKAHVWTNTGNNTFSYSWKWEVNGFQVNEIRNRMFQFQETNDNPEKNFGMAGLYNYGANTNMFYKWVNNSGSNWNFGTFTPLLCGPKSLSVNDVQTDGQSDVNIYPNPSSGIVNYSGLDISKIEIFNMNGQYIDLNESKFMSNKLDLSKLEKGIYFIHFTNTSEVVTVKKIVLN